MPDKLILFEWQVSKTGYCWWENWEGRQEWTILAYKRSRQRQEIADGDLYLVANVDLEDTPAADITSPLSATGLFRDFASLESSAQAVLGFANRYGLLTAGELVVASHDGAEEGADISGEPLSVWVTEIGRMSFLFQFWQLIQNSDKRALASAGSRRVAGAQFVGTSAN